MPFRWPLNCRRVTQLNGLERALEWVLLHESESSWRKMVNNKKWIDWQFWINNLRLVMFRFKLFSLKVTDAFNKQKIGVLEGRVV